MSLFLFLKQIVDVLYQYHWMDYAMVVMVVIALGYQIVLVRPKLKGNVTLTDVCIIGFIVLVGASYLRNPQDGYGICVKVMSGFLMYFVGRIYYERIQECEKALALSSYIVVYANFAYRIYKHSSELFVVHNVHGDLYYYDMDMGYGMILALVFITMYAKNSILKLITIFVVIPFMLFFSEAGTMQMMYIIVMLLFLLYLFEKIGVNKKICNSVLFTSLSGLIIAIFDITLPVFFGREESLLVNIMEGRVFSLENMKDRYSNWHIIRDEIVNSNWLERLAGKGLGYSISVNSQYLKLVYVTGIIGVLLAFLIGISMVYKALIVNDRKTYYVTMIQLLTFLAAGCIANSMEYTQMSWFVMMFMGMTTSSIHVERDIRLEGGQLKSRIAMLGHKHMPSREGGVEVVVEELSTRLVKAGHEVTCYNRMGHHISGRQYKNERVRKYKGVRTVMVPTINRRGLAATSSSVFASLFSAYGNYDLVHFHAEGNCVLMWFVKLFGKRCIATVHGLDHQRAKWGKFARWYILLGEKMMVKYADEIIVLSQNVQKYFMDTYGRETVFIPNGVTRPEIKEAAEIKEKYGLDKDEYILFLGRIVPDKGIGYLLDAYMELEKEMGSKLKKLVIAGGSSDTKAYQKELMDRAEGHENIIFTDFIQGQTLEELYSNAYIYVLPSDLEGMPLSLLEAMSYGNCCVTSDIPECKSVIGQKGVSFNQGDVKSLKKVLRELLNDDARVQKYKSEAADYILENYNWDHVVDRTRMLYNVSR